MSEKELLVQLQGIVDLYLEEPYQINSNTDLLNDLSLSSVDFVNILADIEDTFQYHIKYEEMLKMRIVKDIMKEIMG